jgi:hypothetical protein
MRKLTTILLSIAVLMIVFCASAFAQSQVQILNVSTPSNNDTNVTYDNGTMTLTIFEPAATANEPYLGITGVAPSVVTFSPLTETPGGYVPGVAGVTSPEEFLSGGTFTVTNGGTTLLSGAFTGATLTPGNNPASGQVSLTDLTLTGGTFIPAGADVNNLLGLNGGVIQFTTNNGTTVTSNNLVGGIDLGTGFASFTGHDDVEISTTVTPTGTPEPASYATFGIGALVMLILACVAKRRSLTASL